MRQQLAIIFGFIQRTVLHIPYKDTQCGFKMFTAEAAERFFPQTQYECAYFDAELLYVAHKQRARIGELGVTWRHDNETRLPIGTKRTIELVKKLFTIPRIHRHDRVSADTLNRASADTLNRASADTLNRASADKRDRAKSDRHEHANSDSPDGAGIGCIE
jgi:dolichyl-phosphate beta-glucosyltransferase